MKGFAKHIGRSALWGAVFSLAIMCVVIPAYAADFPRGNIILVTGNTPGSGGDLFSRAVAQAVNGTPLLNGYSLIVENRPGASGGNALNYVKNARPDGYTVLVYTISQTLNEILNDLPVGIKDFTPLCSILRDDQMLLVQGDSKWKTLKELVDDAIANPGQQVWGRGVPSGADTLSQLIFLKSVPGVENVDVKSIPYDGGGELLTALLGRHVDVATVEYNEAKAQLDSGRLRALGVLAAERSPVLPDVPTAKEFGYDTVIIRPRGFLVPKGTPADMVETLTAIFKTAVENEKFVKEQTDAAATIMWSDSEGFGKILDDLHKYYVDVDIKGMARKEAEAVRGN
ncbi:MAG: tripartite tricarboxylate transporter substrate binding protein [Synergistaceae bacterium]|jgi:tripartite-type tricarboxylate transporter receptor subunit TctC|nr:tripartite tricarboxylate transporter substrate binding protein [Synergistaceae bacterium]